MFRMLHWERFTWTNAYSHSQRQVPRGFPLFKHCKWLVSNRTVSIWTSLYLLHSP